MRHLLEDRLRRIVQGAVPAASCIILPITDCKGTFVAVLKPKPKPLNPKPYINPKPYLSFAGGIVFFLIAL